MQCTTVYKTMLARLSRKYLKLSAVRVLAIPSTIKYNKERQSKARYTVAEYGTALYCIVQIRTVKLTTALHHRGKTLALIIVVYTIHQSVHFIDCFSRRVKFKALIIEVYAVKNSVNYTFQKTYKSNTPFCSYIILYLVYNIFC